jgi:hypothetical protein
MHEKYRPCISPANKNVVLNEEAINTGLNGTEQWENREAKNVFLL